jgi:outer membrane protein
MYREFSMKKMMKKTFLCAVLGLGFALNLEAQIKTVPILGVVNVTKVYNAFPSASREDRDLETEKVRVQAEVDRMTAEIRELENARLAADGRGDREQSLKLYNEIYEKSESLIEYGRVKNAEIANKRAKLSQSGGFQAWLNTAIDAVAVSGGYSMVLRVSDNILWYSGSVDITELVKEYMAKHPLR